MVIANQYILYYKQEHTEGLRTDFLNPSLNPNQLALKFNVKLQPKYRGMN